MRASPAQVQKIRHSMGLDQPVAVQYWRYLGRVVHGDLGTSPRTGQTVISEIKSRLPYTVELAVLGTLLGVIFGIPLGVWAATHKGRWPDAVRSEEHTSELQSLMRTSYAVFCLEKKKTLKKLTNTKENERKTLQCRGTKTKSSNTKQ